MTLPQRDKRLAAHLTWQEFDQRVKDNYIFILTVGAIEQHGLHLPIGFDYLMGHEVALELANRYPVVVMPPLQYGYRSQATVGGGDQFPGTTCVGAQALIATVRDILEELLRHGVRRIVVNNSHLENHNFLVEGIELARRNVNLEKHGCKILLTGWGNFVQDATLDALFDGKFPGWDPEHAAVIETSAMLAIHPEYVDMSRLPDESCPRYPKYSIFPTPPDVVTKNGALAPAKGTSLEKGKRILQDVFNGYAEAFKTEFGL
ncbi:MAG: creatininase [Anaerolineaceae bacterium]|nr:creatininase [Anaerolineaceae bacterium]